MGEAGGAVGGGYRIYSNGNKRCNPLDVLLVLGKKQKHATKIVCE